MSAARRARPLARLAFAALALAACSETAQPILIDAAPPPDARPPDARPRIDAPPFPDAAPPDAAEPPPRYTTDRTQSPITASVAKNIEEIALRGPTLTDNVFSKVGDSITVALQFMTCFAGSNVDLGARSDLEGTLDHFKLARVGATTPYDRVSLAASVGKSADWAITGDPSPLTMEVSAALPRYAVVMFGSNDVAARSIFTFGASMLEIIDQLMAQGVVPLMSTIPPNDNATYSAAVPRYNAVVRGIAQARQVPLMDLNREMLLLPDHGLGIDKLHPNFYSAGACLLTAAGLQFGYNVRNLLTLDALDRARSVVEGDPPPDALGMPAVIGAGSYASPFIIGSLPFTDLHDTSASPNRVIDRYTGCNATQDESGPEYVYKISLATTTTVHAFVIVRAGVDVDVHLMRGLTGADCILRNDRELQTQLAPGTYYFVLDTYVKDGTPLPGEYLFVLVSEP